MKKKLLLSTISVLVIIVQTGILLSGCRSRRENAAVSSSGKPNIIFILADDLGYGDLSCYGQTNFQTPNIDKLAKEGMRFTQHYAGSTVCAPSRSSLMTGQHTGHTKIRGNKGVKPEGQFPLNSEAVTIAELLKEAGYVTGAFGKWGLGYPGSEGDPNNQGFDEFYGYKCQTLGHNYYPYYLWHNQTKEILEGNKGKETNTYGPEIIHEKALAFIEKNKDTTFFLYYPSIIPHAELLAPDNYMDKFRGKYLPETKYVGIDDGPSYKKGGYGSQDEPHTAFAAMINILDEQVGELHKKLEDLGIAENTILIFTSDNGPHKEGGADPDYFDSNGKLQGYKRDLYEGGIRVPMIVCWPGKIPAGTLSKHVSAFWDFLPTVCDLVKICRPDSIDGISFLPELMGNEQKKHDYLYWEFHEQNGKQAVRMGNWKGIRLNMDENPNASIELYDLSTDIEEKNNIAGQHPQIVDEINKIMEEQHIFSKDFSFSYEKE
jgi:arylsulfatase A